MKQTYAARYAVVVLPDGPFIYFPDFNHQEYLDNGRVSPEALAYSTLLELVQSKPTLPAQPMHLFPFLNAVKRWLRLKGLSVEDSFVDHGLVTVTWEVNGGERN